MKLIQRSKEMKSLTIFTVERAKRGILAFTVMVAILSPAAFADGGTWILDSTNSSVSLFQGSRANPESVNTGVARVTGTVMLDTNDLDNSVFDLAIYPADENWGQALSMEGILPTGYVLDGTDHALLTFKSTRILRTQNGKLKVMGDLTLTRVERSVAMDGNEAYAGPVFGKPTIHSDTREVAFLFPNSSLVFSSRPLSPAIPNKHGSIELSGATRVVQEDFPELPGAIQSTNWPAVVKNETCQMPSTVGEDYRGATCTGTVIAAAQNYNCQIQVSAGGEGYSGPVCTPPAGSQTTIALDLKLLPTNSEPVAEMRSGDGATR
jgi:polyisoprenoid-binding protein YceI